MDQTLTVKDLLEAGVHFGHRARRWNPKMKPYIFGKKNGIYIIDLEKTLDKIRNAYQVVRNVTEAGKDALFVGTKQQARPIIEEEANRCSAFYVTERWLGGLLTNFDVVSTRILRLVEMERMIAEGRLNNMTKKEIANFERERQRLAKIFSGVKEMDRVPGVVFIVDVVREATALAEARRVKIPVVGFIDTNGDPDLVDYPIPGNDDAMRSIKLITHMVADAVIEGKKGFETEREEMR
ncbi:MAG: 30S ribosomal protein S2 [bacterium]|nr:30S ribosomal protein S2 [candidate division WOR-3 bacterium]